MTSVNKATALRLATFIERVERLAEEKKALEMDIREVFAEAKDEGFDVPALKAVIAKRRKDPEKIKELAAVEDTYIAALGVLTNTPLGTWAREHMEAESNARVEAALATHDVKVSALADAMGLAE